MTIEFSDRSYWRSHGKAPRGRGWWLFSFEGYEFSHSGTLTEAKKACRAYVRSVAPADYEGLVTVNIEP